MAKSPPKKPKDPARPTRAKAARPDEPQTPDELAALLNPGIAPRHRGPGFRHRLQPPPETSWERRQDFSAAHRARKSAQGFEEAPQQGFEEAPQARLHRLADHRPRSRTGARNSASAAMRPPCARPARPAATRNIACRAPTCRRPGEGLSSMGVAATAESLEKLLREGRPEFARAGEVWTPHRPPRPEKSEGGQRFVIKSDFEPKGDQPTAIRELVEGVKRHDRTQVLLGVTGSGKTFTMAKVIEATQRPALILAPNKTLAAQLYGEFKSFFPDNAVEYFVSYYDYYQPEAYVPRTDTYIEKESSINEQIDRMRHSATRALLERDDVIIVASVSCIYGIGSVETYSAMTFTLKKGGEIEPAPAHRRPGGAAIQAHAGRLLPRRVPRARRHRRHLPGALRGPRLARASVRRRDREDRGDRPAHRRQDRRAGLRQDLRQLALRHAAPDAHCRPSPASRRSCASVSPSSTPPAACWKRSAWSSARASTSR